MDKPKSFDHYINRGHRPRVIFFIFVWELRDYYKGRGAWGDRGHGGVFFIDIMAYWPFYIYPIEYD